MPPLTGLKIHFGLVFYKDAAPNGASVLENLVAVVAKKLRVGFGQFVRQPDGLVGSSASGAASL